MQVWNVLHAASSKYRIQKFAKKSPSAYHRTTLLGCIFVTKARIDNQTKSVKHQYPLYVFPQYGELRLVNGWDRLVSLLFGAPQQISVGFASWLRYCTDVAQRRSIKLCMMLGRLLGWYTIYTFGRSCPLTEFCQVQNWLCVQVLRSPILAALLHGTRAVGLWESAKLCGVVQGMELRNFCSSSFSTQGATYIPRAAITLGIGPHSSLVICFSSCELTVNSW